MNIQLRDSKVLQTNMLKVVSSALNREVATLPKAQLHPELIEGHVDTDSGGFAIHSKNSIDVRNLGWFFSAPGACTASWRMCGKDDNRIASELVFAFEDNSKLVVRTQSSGDQTRLTSTLPSDQKATFNASYEAGRLTLSRQGSAPAQSGLSDADLQVRAAVLGVEWDTKASRETMLDRIIEAAGKQKVEPKVKLKTSVSA